MVVRDAGRCQDIKVMLLNVSFYFITLVLIINLIYAEIVYMNIMTFCTAIIYFDILVEMVGFEPGIL
jgi:hypothetical protein